MISPSNLLKRVSARGRLVPFFKTASAYFVLGGGAASPTAAALKCAPVLCLLLAVLLRARAAPPPQRRYARAVGVGLALSAVGDALLVWDGQAALLRGMAAFAGAHAAYLAAYGLRPLAPVAGAALLAAAALYTRLLTLPAGPLRALVPAYALLVAGAAWRGAARGGPQRPGALLLLLSDAVLGYGLFGGPVPHQQVLVMSTYYLGQCGVALSALEPRAAAAH